jgi:hypothetical protein
MGFFRFRRRAGFLGGLFHLNFSKTGISASVGMPGATLNIPVLSSRKRNPAVTVGLPGTGLSYRQELKGQTPAQSGPTVLNTTIQNATPERTEEALAAVRQAAAMVNRAPTISDAHEVPTTQADIDRHVKIRFRQLKACPVYQVIDRGDQHIMSEHATEEDAKRWIAENVHVHIRQIDVRL